MDGGESLKSIDHAQPSISICGEVEGGQRDAQKNGLDKAGLRLLLPDLITLEIRGQVEISIVDHVNDLTERKRFRIDANRGRIVRAIVAVPGGVRLFELYVGGFIRLVLFDDLIRIFQLCSGHFSSFLTFRIRTHIRESK